MDTSLDETARSAAREQRNTEPPATPTRELVWARRGTAYFARKLGELTDAELDRPSLLPGWSRRHVIAHVGYNARALSRLMRWAHTGVETPMYPSPEHRDAEIRQGATLPAHALRSLFEHTAAHLDAEWRDLPDTRWNAEVRTAQGRLVPVRETAWMRTREVWVHAVDLDSGADMRDFPSDLLSETLADVLRAWRRRGERVDLTIAVADREPIVLGTGDPTVSGTLPGMVRWLTGRGARGLTSSTGVLPVLPRWF